MDAQDLKNARSRLKNERNKTAEMKSNAKTVFVQKVEASAQLKCELDIQERLLQQIEESRFRMEEIQQRYQLVILDKADRNRDPFVASDARCSIEVTSGFQVANNTLVVRKLLRFFDMKELLKCRLINRLWDDEVVRLLTEKPDYFPHWYKNPWCDLDVIMRKKAGEKALRNFHLLLEKSKHPELLVKVLQISFETVLFVKAHPNNILECENILGKFGKHVKKLEIDDEDEHFSILSWVLGRNGYCPNVEDLDVTIKYSCCLHRVTKLPYFIKPFIKNMGILKLKTLRFVYGESLAYDPNGLMVFHGILDQSPGIQSLTIGTKLDYQRYWETHRFVEILKSKSQSTRNLKYLYWSGEICDNLEGLCQLQFGPSLKEIYFTEDNDTNDSEKTTIEHKEYFTKFLRNVCGSVESFNFESYYEGSITPSDIPLLPKLKKLYFSGCTCLQPWDFQFIQNLPLLETLSVDFGRIGSRNGFRYEKQEHLQPSKPCSLNCIPRVEEMPNIHLSVRHIYSPETLRNLNVGIPNLSHLELGLGPLEEYPEDLHQLWFEQSFLFISQMINLKNLQIEFWWRSEDTQEIHLHEAFCYLKNMPNLVELALFKLELNADFKIDSLLVLLEASKLR